LRIHTQIARGHQDVLSRPRKSSLGSGNGTVDLPRSKGLNMLTLKYPLFAATRLRENIRTLLPLASSKPVGFKDSPLPSFRVKGGMPEKQFRAKNLEIVVAEFLPEG